MASFNAKLRKVAYGRRGASTNPMLHMPAGVVGTTWHGTGFEEAPKEPVELDQAALPWELQPEAALPAASAPESSPAARQRREKAPGKGLPISLAVLLAGAAIVYVLLNGGFYS